jgi:hypothetical protein
MMALRGSWKIAHRENWVYRYASNFQGKNVIFIFTCMAGALLGAAFALKLRPTSKSEIIVQLADRIEQLENQKETKT